MPSKGNRRRTPRRGQWRLRLSIMGAASYHDLPAHSTLRRWIGMALEADARITLVFVDARVGRRLNRQFRGRDYATNVLTFAYQSRPAIVAEIVLCVPVVRSEARRQGKTLRQHLAHLLVHGVLHAQGYEHGGAREAKKMQGREQDLLATLRIPDPYG